VVFANDGLTPPPSNEHTTVVIVTVVASILAWVAVMAVHVKNLFFTKKAKGEQFVTQSVLQETMGHVNGKFDSARRDMLERLQTFKEKQDSQEHKLERTVTREELLNSREALMTPLIQSVREHGETLHQMRDQMNKMGLDMERGISGLRRILAVLQERVKQLSSHGKDSDTLDPDKS
jgi:hypothetical protein